jgi:hypothetical protein
MREGLREVGRGIAGFGRWLLVVVLAHGAVVAAYLALGLAGLWVLGVGRRFDRWVQEHHVSPGSLVQLGTVPEWVQAAAEAGALYMAIRGRWQQDRGDAGPLAGSTRSHEPRPGRA